MRFGRPVDLYAVIVFDWGSFGVPRPNRLCSSGKRYTFTNQFILLSADMLRIAVCYEGILPYEVNGRCGARDRFQYIRIKCVGMWAMGSQVSS